MSGNLPLTSAAGLTTGVGAVAGLLVATPQTTIGYQPQNPPTQLTQTSSLTSNQINQFVGNLTSTVTGGLISQPPPSIIFNYEGEQTSTLKSDITDHYVEDNTAVQDQIALKPVMITTQGYIGELNDIPPNSLLAAAQTLANKLSIISGYLPSISATALIAYNEAVFVYNNALALANSAVSAATAIGGVLGNTTPGINGESVITGSGIQTFAPNQNKQQTAYQQFYGYWSNRILFTIQTPWAVFENMAIDTLRAIQDAETNVITDFEVTFKQIRYAITSSTDLPGSINPENATGQLAAQSSPAAIIATNTPSPVSSVTASVNTIIPT
jgi:hypothetical protein